MNLEYQNFDKIIQSKKIYPTYLFAGDETYFIDESFRKIKNFIEFDELNKEVFYGEDKNAVNNVLDALQTGPFLSRERIVVLKNSHNLSNGDMGKIYEYTKNPVRSSVFIVFFNSNAKKSSSVLKPFLESSNCVFINCDKVYERNLPFFIKKEFAKREKIADTEVIDKLIDENGVDILSISNEIEKICLYVDEGRKKISVQDLENIGGYAKEIGQFALASAIEEKNLKNALFIFEKTVSAAIEDPVITLSKIAASIRKLLTAKSMLEEQKLDEQKTAAILKIHPYFAKKFFINLKKHSIKNLKKSLKFLLRTDESLKTGKGDFVSESGKLLLFLCGE
jgi:DNA polymerase-3 subunit delta